MIDDVIFETIYIAYNVLGSYASNYPLNDKYYIIYPADMTIVMSRSVILPVSPKNERSANFLSFICPKNSVRPKLSKQFTWLKLQQL